MGGTRKKNFNRGDKKKQKFKPKVINSCFGNLDTKVKGFDKEQLKQIVIDQLKTVYDPEFSLVDLYTLGLIYDIQLFLSQKEVDSFFETKKEKEKYEFTHFPVVVITMTFTTPMCPMGDMLVQMVKNAILEKLPDREVYVEVVFDPLWKVDMIKDEDVRKIFEQ